MNKLLETRFHIVLPFRGREDYFKETVRSVLAQTYKNWNLTIFDNASESTTLATWIAELNDERIKYLRFENQVSLIRNFCRAVDGIDAEWGLILGADDTLEKNFLSAGLSTINNFPFVSAILPRVVPIDSESHVSWTLVDRVNLVARPLKSDGVFENHAAIGRLCITNWMYITSMLVRKETFKTFPFDLDLENTFDLDFMFKMLIAGNNVAFSSEAVFYYRRHSQTASLNIDLALARAKEEQLIFTNLSNRFWDRRQIFLYLLSQLRIGYRAYVFVRALKLEKGSKWALLKIALSPGAKLSI
jgi:glycosyltransferase involved in cell wall biosynthesis